MKIINPIEIKITEENVAKITVNRLLQMIGCSGIPYISVGGYLIDTEWTEHCLVTSDRKKHTLRKANDMDKAVISIIKELIEIHGVDAYGDH